MAPHKSDLSLDDVAIRKEVYCLKAYSGLSSYVLYLLLPCSPFHTLFFYFKLFTIELRFASLTLFVYIAMQFCRWQVHLHVRLSPFPLSLVLCVEYLSCTVSDLRIKKTPSWPCQRRLMSTFFLNFCFRVLSLSSDRLTTNRACRAVGGLSGLMFFNASLAVLVRFSRRL